MAWDTPTIVGRRSLYCYPVHARHERVAGLHGKRHHAMIWRSRNGFFPACSRPAICISAIISARSSNFRRAAGPMTASIASSICTRSRCAAGPARSCRAQHREVTAAFIACGIDPKKHIVFNQSQVAEHAELAWVFNCVARLGWLNRMTQFKEKAGKDRENASVGLTTIRADGGRHSGLSRHPCAGRRGPEAASRAVARHRAEIQQ
jgi:hypothetical protein